MELIYYLKKANIGASLAIWCNASIDAKSARLRLASDFSPGAARYTFAEVCLHVPLELVLWYAIPISIFNHKYLDI